MKLGPDALMAKGVKHLILVDATWRFAREMAAVLREKERVQFAIISVDLTAKKKYSKKL